jgi:hypothetical protein
VNDALPPRSELLSNAVVPFAAETGPNEARNVPGADVMSSISA